MATLTVTYTFTNGTPAQAAEVNKNFDDTVVFVNGSVVHTDGSKPFTAIPTIPTTDPSTDGHVASKKYVDDKTKILTRGQKTAASGNVAEADGYVEVAVTGLAAFTMPDLSSGTRQLDVEVYVPRFSIVSADSNGIIKVALRHSTSSGSFLAFGQSHIGTNGFQPDNTSSLYVKRSHFDNSVFAAGSTVTPKLYLSGVDLGGSSARVATWADANNPLQVVIRRG